MKVKRMGMTDILRRIWLFTANKIKFSEYFSKQPTQLIVDLNSIIDLNSSLPHIILTNVVIPGVLHSMLVEKGLMLCGQL